MNTETGEVFNQQNRKQMERMLRQQAEGAPIVEVSEKVARQQRAGQIAMRRTQMRTQRRSQDRSKYKGDGTLKDGRRGS